MKNKVIQFFLKNQKLLAVFALGLLIVLGAFTRIPSIDGHLEGFNIDSLKQYKSGVKIADNFGSTSIIQLNIVPEKTDSYEVLFSMTTLGEKLNKQIEGVRVQSLHQSTQLLKLQDDQSIYEVLKRASDLPLIDQLISKDKQSFLFIVHLDPEVDFDLDLFNSIIEKPYPGIKEINVLSSLHLEREIVKAIGKDVLILPSIILLFFALFILFVYKSFSSLVFTMILIGGSIAPAFFFFHVLEIPLNLITVLAIPVLLVLVLADSIHLLTGYRSASEYKSHDEKLKFVLGNYFVPSLITSITTAIAFLSFQFNDAENIRNFGLIAGITVLLAFIITYSLAGFLLQFVKPKNTKTHWVNSISNHLNRYKLAYSLVSIVVFISSIFFLPSLKFDTNMDTFIPNDSKFYKDKQEFSKQYYSMYHLEVMIEKKDSTSSTRDLKQLVIDLHEKLELQPEIAQVSSIKDQVDYKSRFGMLGGYIRFPSKFNPYHTQNNNSFRLDVCLNDARELSKMEAFIEQSLKKESAHYELSTFSTALLMDELNSRTSKSLLQSLLFSGLLITFFIFLMTRSIRHTLISILANLVPLSFIVLIFYFFDQNLNILTAMTSVVCIGLIVDDTVHLLYRRLVLKSELKEVSFGIIVTTVILCGGFAAMSFSNFSPSQTFGVICAVTFLVALINDLTLLPYLIYRFSKKPKD